MNLGGDIITWNTSRNISHKDDEDCKRFGKRADFLNTNILRKKPENTVFQHVYAMSARNGDVNTPLYTSDTYEGACLDSGAEQSVIERKQANAYIKETERKISKVGSRLIFKFGDGEKISQGILTVRVPFPDSRHAAIPAHVLDADIPFLIGMEILHREIMIMDFDSRTIKMSKNNGKYT